MGRGILFLIHFFGLSFAGSAFADGPCELPAGHPVSALVAYLKNPGSPAPSDVKEFGDHLVNAFAPRIWWHRDERYFAMDPGEFLTQASLWKSYTAGVAREVKPRGKVAPEALSKLGADYYLKFEGNRAEVHNRPAMFWRLGTGKAASDYCGKSAKGASIIIEYWYHVAFNYATRVGIGNHEGDWEGGGILVDLQADGKAIRPKVRAGFLSAHEGGNWFCPSELKWVGTHPVVYSAIGTHATYATPGGHKGPVMLDETSPGRAWDAWNDLRPMVLEPYYGFQGRWGDLSLVSFMSGPEVPSPGKKAQPRDNFPVTDLGRCVSK